MPKSISDVYEKEYIRKDGRIFPVELRTSLIKDEKGKSILMWAVVRDITEKKHIENALLEEEKKLKSILVNTRYGIALTDKQDKFVMVNPYFCNLIGYSESELMEMSYKDITYAEDLAESGNQMNLLKERKIKNFSLIKRYVRKDKKIIWGKVGVGAIYDDKKEVAYSVISLEDITESRNEDQVRKDFVSLAGHQLRTPLTGIKWFVELARVNAGNISNNELNQYLNNISESNERLIHLVNDLLRVSKVDSGKLSKTGFSKNKIEDLILSSIAEQKTMILDKKVKVTGLNKLGKNLSIKCDRLQVLEALGNVINNAIKYSLVGSEIRIGIIEGEAKVALVVEDKGIGIPKEQQPRLFEKFFRADNVEKTVTGSGLGLYLVKNLVEYNNGKIWIESKEGKGTKVFMEFPKCK
jgi:PAS domain S-box-containing protein